MSKLAILVAVVVVLLAATRVAAADEARDPQTALGWSAGGTAASIGLVGVGLATKNDFVTFVGVASLVFTPSLGQWYTQDYVTTGMGLRVAGLGLGLAAAVDELAHAGCGFASGPSTCGSGTNGSTKALAVAGIATFAGGVVYDLVTARSVTEHYNAQHPPIQLMPTLLTPPSGPVMGAGIGGSF